MDKDNSITSAKVEIYNEEEDLTLDKTLEKGVNQVEVPVEDGKKYKAIFVLAYDLSSNQLQQEEVYAGIETIEKELYMVIDYNLQLTNITAKQDGQSTTIFEKNQPITLTFESTNATIHEPTKIKVNGKEYQVTKNENHYEVTIDAITELGQKEIAIQEIILANGKKFEIENDNKLNITVIKQKPVVSEVKTEEDITQNKMKVKFSLKDDDHTIKSVKVILLDAKGAEIQQQQLSNEEIQNAGSIEKTLETQITSKYKLKVIATYNQTGVETEDVTESILFEQEIAAKPRAEITQVTVDKDYVEKQGNVTLELKIETNKTENISKIRVNNTDCLVTKLKNGSYQVTLQVGEKSGIKELSITKVIYSDNSIADVNETVKVDVLKDKPTVQNFTQEDKIETSQVVLNFDVIDEDNSIVSAKAVLTKQEDGTVVSEKPIQKGKNSVTFDVENAKLYTIQIKATYDRDTSTLENKPEEDNRVTDEVLDTKEIQLLTDYELQISNIKTYKEAQESKYFEKEEPITVKFESTNISKFVPVRAVINGKEYNLTKQNNTYQTTIDAYEESGAKDIVIEKITLNNTKVLPITQNNQSKIEILKDKLTIEKFSYTEGDDNTVTVTFKVNDLEETLTGGEIIITDENNAEVKRQAITKGNNIITFEKVNNSETYNAKILVSYDLDTNTIETGKNEVQNEKMLEQEITIGERILEMKDIIATSLYRKTGTTVNKVSRINIADLNDLTQYFVQVDMKEMKSFNAGINKYTIENNTLYFTIDLPNMVQYEESEKVNSLQVKFGELTDNVVENIDLETLVAQIKENPAGNYKLTMDSDASLIESGSTLIGVEFTGSIDFGGHTIKNLSKPLFNNLNGATIENLVIKDSGTTAHGIFAETINASTIRNVHIRNIMVTAPNEAGTGSFAGKTNNKTLIENCSAVDVTVGNAKRTGGYIGQANNTTIKNSYIQGHVSSNSDGSGGFIGEVPSGGVVLENIYANVTVNFGGGSNAGICGYQGYQNYLTLRNTISMPQNERGAQGFRVYGDPYGYKINGANNYELSTSNMGSQAWRGNINTVTPESLKTKEFYTNTLKWSEEIWDFSKVSEGKYPTLKSEPKEDEKQENSNIYIPDYNRVKELSNYDNKREIAYHNMYKLMPFYDAKHYIEDGNKIDLDHILNTKIIAKVYAYDANDKWIVGLSKNTKNSIKKIRLLFTDNESISYPVTYKEDDTRIVHYTIDEIGIDYSYDKYLVDTSSDVYKFIVNKVKTFNYNNDLSVLTSEKEVRSTIEHYDTVQQNAEDFALKLMANSTEFNIVTENTIIENSAIQKLSTNKMIEKLVYSYNHFGRYYDINIGGINLSDVVYFDGSMFSTAFNPIGTTSGFMGTTSEMRSSNRVANYYANHLKQYTRLDLMSFLEYFIKNLTIEKYKNDPASWIIDTWDGGVIYEQPAARFEQVRYRVWDHFKALAANGDNRPKQSVLMLLSYHYDDMYILGILGTILVGNLRMYFGNNYDATPYETRLKKLTDFSNIACTYFDTVAGAVYGSRGFTNLSNLTQISYDSTQVRNWSNVADTPNPYKHYHEPTANYITTPSGSAAFGNTSWGIWWVNSWALSSFGIFTHESAHNTEDRIFFEGQGQRCPGASENYTNDFLTQYNGTNTYVPNYSYTNSWVGNPFTSNFSYKRIDTREKINDYYKKVFDTYAFMDYIEAQAFLKLTPEEQSKVAMVMQDNNGSVSHLTKTKEDFEAMNLKTIEDLWDNKIINVRAGTANSLHNANWYLPSNSNGGMTKSYMILHSYQLMGDFGFGAYAKYNSSTVRNDLDALQKITGDNTMTWKTYQLSRFDNIKNNLSNFEYFDINEIENEMLQAMRLDIENGLTRNTNSYIANYRNNLFGYLKRVTGDYETGIFEPATSAVHVRSAEELIEVLKDTVHANISIDADLDFTNIEVTDETTSMAGDFTGCIEGNNHKIIGLKKPLFTTASFVNMQDIHFENCNITTSKQGEIGIFAKILKYSTIKNVTFDNGISVRAVNKAGTLAGTLNNSTIENISIDNAIVATSTSGDNIGGLYGIGASNYIKNVHVSNSNISGKDSVGGIAGYTNNNVYISQVTFSGNITGTRNSSGGLFGQLHNSRLENAYATGTIRGGDYVGGIAGFAPSSKIDKVMSHMLVTGNNLARTGGIVGHETVQTSGAIFPAGITNSISLGKVNNGHKFVGTATKEIIEGKYSNNYELEEISGHESSEKTGIDLNGRISTISIDNVNEEFYKNSLGWNSAIWDFTNVSIGGLPKQKGLDKNNVEQVLDRIEISTKEDFLKINDKLDGDYILMADIDFTKETGSSVIEGRFTGKIEGKNHTISNLNNLSLFENFRGIVQNLNISNFTNTSTGRGNGDFVTAFAQETYTAKFKNMKFENITLSGRSNVAVLTGMDGRENANSVFKNISVKNANVTGTGVYVSTFVGRKWGGIMKNIYVQGTLNIEQTENGGLVGAIHKNITIENVITDIDITKSKNTYGTLEHKMHNGSLIGNIYDTQSIKNSIAFGNMTGYTDSNGQEEIPFKCVGAIESQIIACLTKCYEVSECDGATSVSDGTAGHLDTIARNNLNADFYRSLGFDESIWDFTKITAKGYPELK